MTRDDATEAQVRAADPAQSTWLSANAGSGKTRVLIDRVARLLLGGVEPQRILCLTYTKAAATEMQNRLFRRLGDWAMMPPEPLLQALADLGVDPAPDATTLAAARRLFARAIETPGGLRIQTIHSFCGGLLRRFPLEAGVSPGFVELDDRAARLMRDAIVQDLAGRDAGGLADLARAHTGEDLASLTEEIARNRPAFARPMGSAELRALFGLPADLTPADLAAQVFAGDETAWLPRVAEILAAGSPNDRKAAAALTAALPLVPGPAALPALEDLFLTGARTKTPFAAKIGKLATRDTQARLGPLADRLDDLMARVEAARPRRLALVAADRAALLHRFAAVFLPDYAARKAARGLLDFDDLILRAEALLTDPSVAQWVLYRLDGGIDHILVDEAQDTSPAQWRVIELLAQEFTAGQGARDVARTIFVVGDKKQSIYSFQGADLAAFDRMKAHFARRLADVRLPLADRSLEYSFRSSPAVLRVVDLCFDPAQGRGLGGPVRHIAFRGDLPGRVDLWPPIPPDADETEDDWTAPVDLVTATAPAARLAGRIAATIRDLIAAGTQISTADGPRPLTPGDVMILVQRRSDLFAEIIRACKAAGLPIAGADRLKLGAELAVQDLTAVLAFLATPEDDLSLAAVLRSPLLGWTEGQLYALARPRTGYLWAALRQAPGVGDTLAILTDLRDQADFLRPYELLDRMLTRHGGRARLIARLGPEAEDGIDALLTQALAYEASEVPSLTGFLVWLSADEVQVKRQLDSAGGLIRVMTVHGAKGLEAPLVILPETQDRDPRDEDQVLPLGATALWRLPAEDRPPAMAALAEARRTARAEESLRLLYVAMTRAQSWLIVAAAGKTTRPDCWWSIVAEGMQAAGARAIADGVQRVEHGAWPAPAATISQLCARV
ncbi:MAG: double-strand break repair helicase AddA, partial [Rhodobacterales bacterium]|nr:double-strand break repair helicase AddA [Rhodobacterales bacterium]